MFLRFIYAAKKRRAVRVWFLGCGATTRLDLKREGLVGVSRLKGIETQMDRRPCHLLLLRLVGVSRLKGIETRRVLERGSSNSSFGRSFPFEGN